MIIIDSDNYGANDIQTMFFPGGEPHVKVPMFREPVLLFAKLRTWSDTTFAALVTNAISNQETCRSFDAFIPYFPAARQDRYDQRSALTLRIVAEMFGDTRRISVFDAHSHVLCDTWGIRHSWMPADLEVPGRLDVAGIIAPDAGAVWRATDFRDHLYPAVPVICATKERNRDTGALSGYSLPSLHKAGHYIVVDDICDGGGTFNLLAEAFDRQAFVLDGPCSLELFVSHGIFSKGLDAIAPLYCKITTTNSWCRPEQFAGNSRLTVLPLEPLLPQIIKDIKDIK